MSQWMIPQSGENGTNLIKLKFINVVLLDLSYTDGTVLDGSKGRYRKHQYLPELTALSSG